MIRLVALEWDGKEARIAVARGRGKAVVLEQAFVVEATTRWIASRVASATAAATAVAVPAAL